MARLHAFLSLMVASGAACGASAPEPSPRTPQNTTVSGERPVDATPEPEPTKPLPAPPPAYGNRLVRADPERGYDAFDSAAAAQPGEGAREAKCVDFWPQARYRNYGYDHIVHLLSRCDLLARCVVTTDVAPDAIEVDVPPRAQVEVLTFRGSPAREFTARAACRFRT